MNQAPARQKQGMSTLSIVLIVLAVLFVVVLGTCGVGALWLRGEVKQVEKNMSDGGLLSLVSPPAVVTELSGPKKDYVGMWTSTSGKSTLNIAADGQVHFVEDEHGNREEINAAIAAFSGNDIDIRIGLDVWIKVTELPHKVGDKWQMVARGITFHRDGT